MMLFINLKQLPRLFDSTGWKFDNTVSLFYNQGYKFHNPVRLFDSTG